MQKGTSEFEPVFVVAMVAMWASPLEAVPPPPNMEEVSVLTPAGLTAIALLLMPRLVPAEKTDEAVPAAAAAAS